MKIRNGFVSNSSTSSFICESNRTVYSGYDAYAGEQGYYECDSGHVFSKDHLVGELVKEIGGNGVPVDPDTGYLNQQYCPYCLMKRITVNDEIAFFRKLHGIKSDDDLIKLIDKTNSNIKDLKTLRKYTKGYEAGIQLCS